MHFQIIGRISTAIQQGGAFLRKRGELRAVIEVLRAVCAQRRLRLADRKCGDLLRNFAQPRESGVRLPPSRVQTAAVIQLAVAVDAHNRIKVRI